LAGTVVPSVLAVVSGAMNAALGVCVVAAVELELVVELLELPQPATAQDWRDFGHLNGSPGG
jgi:hypothetical protein